MNETKKTEEIEETKEVQVLKVGAFYPKRRCPKCKRRIRKPGHERHCSGLPPKGYQEE